MSSSLARKAVTALTAAILAVTPLIGATAPAQAAVTGCADSLITSPFNFGRNTAPYGLTSNGDGTYSLPTTGVTTLAGTVGCTTEWKVAYPNVKDGYMVFDNGASVFTPDTDDVSFTFGLDIQGAGGIWRVLALDVTSGTALSLKAGTADAVSPGYSNGYGGTFADYTLNTQTQVWTANATQAANLRNGGKLAILFTIMGGNMNSLGWDSIGSSSLPVYEPAAVVSHSVTFDANGGTGSIAPQSSTEAANLTSNTLTRDGYTFTGWNTAADGSGTAYADGAQYNFSSDVTLYAQWTLNSYTVTFDANGGTGSMDSQTAQGTGNLTSNTLTRDGYYFTGWNTAADGSGTSYSDGAEFPFGSDTTLYAQWALNSYTVTFDANGGNGTIDPQSSTAAANLSTNTLTRAGYHFIGWNTAADGSGTAYADGAEFPFGSDTTLYAQWELNSYTVTFDANGGNGSLNPQSSTAPTNLTGSTLTRDGYTFAGWNTAADGSGTAYADGAEFPFGSDTTLYAQWTQNLPEAPLNAAADNITESTAHITWNAVAYATSYKVYVDGVLVATVTDPAADLTGLTAGTKYTVTIAAVNAAGESQVATLDVITKSVDKDDELAYTGAEVTGLIASGIAALLGGGFLAFKRRKRNN